MSRECDFIKQRASRATPKRVKLIKKQAQATAGRGAGNAFRHTKTGFREDIKIVVRSGWEANICRILNAYGIKFRYEPQLFHFPIQRGTKAYVPDLFLPDTDEWIEIKGYLDRSGKVKLKRFKKYYPEEFSKLTIITGGSKDSIDFFKSIGVQNILLYSEFRKNYKSIIKNWEGS